MDNNIDHQMLKSISPIVMRSIDEEKRTIKFLGTSTAQDRSGDIIETNGWDLNNFMANPVFLWSHDGRSMPPIGRALAVSRTPKGLEFTIEFAPASILPFAETIFKLYVGGFLKGVSVGFLPRKREIITDPQTGDFKGFRFLEQELIELSAVSVPDNPEALIQEAQSGALQKEAAEFLSKSLYAEKSFLSSLDELKKEILLMTPEEVVKTGDVTPEGQEPLETTETKTEDTDKSIDKRLSILENEIEQLKAHAGMHKSATEVFTTVKTLLESIQLGSVGEKKDHQSLNPFLNILAPGNVPQGKPQDVKELMEAISKATGRVSSWKPAEPKTEN